jgi:DNA-binding MarR family transcriptional regulator
MEFGELLAVFLIDLLALFRKQAAGGELTLPQVLLLSSIPEEGTDMSGLSLTLGVDNSTATRLIDVMVRQGWVKKVRGEQDKRVIRITLSSSGETLRSRIDEKIDKFGRQLYESIPLEDRDEVKEVLNLLHWKLVKMHLKEI